MQRPASAVATASGWGTCLVPEPLHLMLGVRGYHLQEIPLSRQEGFCALIWLQLHAGVLSWQAA